MLSYFSKKYIDIKAMGKIPALDKAVVNDLKANTKDLSFPDKQVREPRVREREREREREIEREREREGEREEGERER